MVFCAWFFIHVHMSSKIIHKTTMHPWCKIKSYMYTKPQCIDDILCMILNTATMPLPHRVGGWGCIQITLDWKVWCGVVGCRGGVGWLEVGWLGVGCGRVVWGESLSDRISVWVVLVIKHRCHVTAQPCTYVSSLLKYKPGRTPHATTDRPHEGKNTGVSNHTSVTGLVTTTKLTS